MRSILLASACVSAVLVIVACGDDASNGAGDGGTSAADAGADATGGGGDDAGQPPGDAAADAPVDAGEDAGAPVRWGFDVTPARADALAASAAGDVVVGGGVGGHAWLQKRDAAGAVGWTKDLGTSNVKGTNVFTSVAFDATGDVVATGRAGEALAFGATTVDPGTFAVKLAANGDLVWKYGPFPTTVAFAKVAVRPNGNVVIAGTLAGANDFGAGAVASNGGDDVLLVELTGGGTLVRALRFGDAADQAVTALAVDATSTFVAGRFAGAIDFGGGAMTGPASPGSARNVFVAKLDAAGAYVAQREMKTSATENRFDGIAIAPSGGLFVAGTLQGASMNLGGDTLVSVGSFDAVLGLFDADLGHVWSKRAGSAYAENTTSVVVDATGNAVFAGFYNFVPDDIGTGPLPGPDGMFLVRVETATGKMLGSLATGSGSSTASGASPRGLASLGGRDVAVIGQFYQGPMKLPSGTLTPSPSANGVSFFVARLGL